MLWEVIYESYIGSAVGSIGACMPVCGKHLLVVLPFQLDSIGQRASLQRVAASVLQNSMQPVVYCSVLSMRDGKVQQQCCIYILAATLESRVQCAVLLLQPSRGLPLASKCIRGSAVIGRCDNAALPVHCIVNPLRFYGIAGRVPYASIFLAKACCLVPGFLHFEWIELTYSGN